MESGAYKIRSENNEAEAFVSIGRIAMNLWDAQPTLTFDTRPLDD